MVYLMMHVYSDQFRSSIMEMRTAGLHRIVDTKRYRIHLFSLVACRDRPACNWPVYLREKTLVYPREKRNNSEQTERKYHRKYVAFHIRA